MDCITKICHECGSELIQNVGPKTFLVRGNNIHVPEVVSYDCPKCNTVIYTDEEVQKIEKFIKESSYGV